MRLNRMQNRAFMRNLLESQRLVQPNFVSSVHPAQMLLPVRGGFNLQSHHLLILAILNCLLVSFAFFAGYTAASPYFSVSDESRTMRHPIVQPGGLVEEDI